MRQTTKRVLGAGHLADKHRYTENCLDVCPYLNNCPSRPEEKPNCIPNYESCIVHRTLRKYGSLELGI